jgi:hypothetical protein
MDQLVLMGRQSGDLKNHHSRLPSPRSQEEGRSADIKNKRVEISARGCCLNQRESIALP